MSESLLRLDGVLAITQLSRSVVYALIKRGLFPSPRKIAGTRCARWPSADIQRWVAKQAGQVP